MGRAPRVGAARENFPSSSREPDEMTRSSSMSSSQRTVSELKDQLGWSTYQWRLFMITGLCIMAESIEVSLLSFLTIECKKEWALTDVQADHIAGSVFVGEICGCLLFGIFADVCGRKPAFALGVFLVAVFGIASAFSQNVDELILYRFGCGLGIGGFSVPYDLLCEFCPNGSRGVAMMSLWIWWTFGSFMVVQIAANTVETSGWRVLTLYCAVPPVLSMLGLFWVDESPNWLVIKSRQKEAEKIFQNVPGFFGLGSSINFFHENNEFNKVEKLYKEMPFFRTLLSNSMMSLQKSFFDLTHYLKDDKDFSEIWNIIYSEYNLTKQMILKLSGFKKLMENEPANKASINKREEIILPLFTIQQFALQKLNKLRLEENPAKNKIKVCEKLITRSLFGSINASRNSA